MTDTIDNRMIMKCVAYQNGVSIGDVTIEDISEVLKQEHTFVWLGLLEATTASCWLKSRRNSGCMTWLSKMPARRISARKSRNSATRCSWCCILPILQEIRSSSGKPIFSWGRVFW